MLVHPHYSYIRPDLMVELNIKPETQCIAKVLASKKILDIVQKKHIIYLNYETYQSIKDPIFQKVYEKLLGDVYHRVRWLDTYSHVAKSIKDAGDL